MSLTAVRIASTSMGGRVRAGIVADLRSEEGSAGAANTAGRVGSMRPQSDGSAPRHELRGGRTIEGSRIRDGVTIRQREGEREASRNRDRLREGVQDRNRVRERRPNRDYIGQVN